MWEKHFICTLKLDFLVLLSSRLSQTFVLEPLQVEGSYIFPLGKAYSTCRAYQISSCRCRRHTELLWSLLSHAGTQLPPAADVRHHGLGVVSTEIFLWQIFPTVFFFFPGLLPPLAIFLFFGAFLPLNMNGQILPLEQIHSRGCLH